MGSPSFSCHSSVRLIYPWGPVGRKGGTCPGPSWASRGQPDVTSLLSLAHPILPEQSWKAICLSGSPPSSPSQPGKCVLPEKVQTQSSLRWGPQGPAGCPAGPSYFKGLLYYSGSLQGPKSLKRTSRIPQLGGGPQEAGWVSVSPLPAPGPSKSHPVTQKGKWESTEHSFLLCNRKPCFLE